MKKIKKIEKKKYLGAPTPPEDQVIWLFAELLANPDMPLSLTLRRESHREDEALDESTIESTTSKKRTLELELWDRTGLGVNVRELVA